MIPVNPVESLLQLSAGYYVSRALHAVAELGVADALGDQPQPAAALATRTGAHAGALDRVLRLLALYGVFEYDAGVVAHTPSSRPSPPCWHRNRREHLKTSFAPRHRQL